MQSKNLIFQIETVLWFLSELISMLLTQKLPAMYRHLFKTTQYLSLEATISCFCLMTRLAFISYNFVTMEQIRFVTNTSCQNIIYVVSCDIFVPWY